MFKTIQEKETTVHQTMKSMFIHVISPRLFCKFFQSIRLTTAKFLMTIHQIEGSLISKNKLLFSRRFTGIFFDLFDCRQIESIVILSLLGILISLRLFPPI